MTPAEPTRADVVALATDLWFHEVISAQTAVEIVAETAGLSMCLAGQLIVADARDRLSRIQHIHIDESWEDE